jgi:hypothetical protein
VTTDTTTWYLDRTNGTDHAKAEAWAFSGAEAEVSTTVRPRLRLLQRPQHLDPLRLLQKPVTFHLALCWLGWSSAGYGTYISAPASLQSQHSVPRRITVAADDSTTHEAGWLLLPKFFARRARPNLPLARPLCLPHQQAPTIKPGGTAHHVMTCELLALRLLSVHNLSRLQHHMSNSPSLLSVSRNL